MSLMTRNLMLICVFAVKRKRDRSLELRIEREKTSELMLQTKNSSSICNFLIEVDSVVQGCSRQSIILTSRDKAVQYSGESM
jgi:hypothetical protein